MQICSPSIEHNAVAYFTVFLTLMKNVSLCIDQCMAGQPDGCLPWQKFKIAIFSYTIKEIIVKLCIMVLLVKLFLLIPLAELNKNSWSQECRTVSFFFDECTYSREIIDISSFDKNF